MFSKTPALVKTKMFFAYILSSENCWKGWLHKMKRTWAWRWGIVWGWCITFAATWKRKTLKLYNDIVFHRNVFPFKNHLITRDPEKNKQYTQCNKINKTGYDLPCMLATVMWQLHSHTHRQSDNTVPPQLIRNTIDRIWTRNSPNPLSKWDNCDPTEICIVALITLSALRRSLSLSDYTIRPPSHTRICVVIHHHMLCQCQIVQDICKERTANM